MFSIINILPFHCQIIFTFQISSMSWSQFQLLDGLITPASRR